MTIKQPLFLASTLAPGLLICLVSQAETVFAAPPARHVAPQRAPHQTPVHAPQARVAHLLPARKITAHREVETIRPKTVARHEEVLHRQAPIEKLETPVRRVQMGPLGAANGFQVATFTDTSSERHPHFSAALKSLIAAHQILQQPAVSGDLTALGELKTAKDELTAASASTRYHAHRSNAMELTGHAIHELEGAPSGNPDLLAQMAIQDVQYCIYMADHPAAN